MLFVKAETQGVGADTDCFLLVEFGPHPMTQFPEELALTGPP
jgi:hypothetical protein